MERFELDESLNYLARRFSKRFELTLLENFKTAGFDISVEKWIALAFIDKYGEKNQQQIGELLNLDKTAMTRLMKYFEDDGCVIREIDHHDKRNKILKITPGGKQLFEMLSVVVNSTLKNAYDDINADDIKIARKVLKQMHKNLN